MYVKLLKLWVYEHTYIDIFYENDFILKTTKDKVVDAECFHFHSINFQGYDWVHQHSYMLIYAIYTIVVT